MIAVVNARPRRVLPALVWFALAVMAAACSVSSGVGTTSPLADGGVADTGASTDGGTTVPVNATVGATDANESSDTSVGADAYDAGPPFDASSLTVVDDTNDAGLPFCTLSTDGRYLLVTVQNEGTTPTGPTTVRVATNATALPIGRPDARAGAGSDGQLEFDRGPLVGFVADWLFTVTSTPRANADPPRPRLRRVHRLPLPRDAGMVRPSPLLRRGLRSLGGTGWWTSANQLETVIDYSRETGTRIHERNQQYVYVERLEQLRQIRLLRRRRLVGADLDKAYDLDPPGAVPGYGEDDLHPHHGRVGHNCGGGIYWERESGACQQERHSQ